MTENIVVKGKTVRLRYVTLGESGWIAVVDGDGFGGEFGDEVPVTLNRVNGVEVIEPKEHV